MGCPECGRGWRDDDPAPIGSAVWGNKLGELQEFEGASRVWVQDGALCFNREDGRTVLIVPPGEWRDVNITYDDDGEDER